MREKIVLRRRTSPKIVTLPKGTTFTARYERISRKQFPINIHVKNVRKIDPRRKNRGLLSSNDAKQFEKIARRKKVRLNGSAVMLKRMKKNKRKQSGKGRGENLAKLGLEFGSKAINSSVGKKLIKMGINSIPNIFKYGVSKIKNKNVKRALNSDIANIVVDEAQSKVRKTSGSLFD